MRFRACGISTLLVLAAVFAAAADPSVPMAFPAALQDGFRIGMQQSGGEVRAIGFDAAGNQYLAGVVFAPTLVSVNYRIGPGGGQQDLFVAKVSASGQRLFYLTEIGGSGFDEAGGLAIDAGGNVYLAGRTSSSDFPVTPGAFQTTAVKGGAFVLKLDATGGRLTYSTFLDDSFTTGARALALDSHGNVFVAGRTDGRTFPTTAGAFMRGVSPDFEVGMSVGFVSEFGADGKTLLRSTLIGGANGFDYVSTLAVDSSGVIHVAGRAYSVDFPLAGGGAGPRGRIESPRSFFARFDPALSRLIFSTLPAERFDPSGLAVDSSGNSFVSGAGVTKFDAAGAVVYRQDFNGRVTNLAGLTLLDDGSVVTGGQSNAPDFPTRDTLEPCTVGAVLVRLGATGNILHSGFLGAGIFNAITAVGRAPDGSLHAVGATYSDAFPGGATLVPSSSHIFAFGFRMDWSRIPAGAPAPSCLVHSATLARTNLAPGAILTLHGSNLGSSAGAESRSGSDGRIPTELSGMRVTVAGIAAPILYAQDEQINFIVPGAVTAASADVCVEGPKGRSCLTASILPYAPGVYRVGEGSAVLNQDGSLNTPVNPADRGSFISVYGTGFGPFTRSAPDGSLAELPLNPLVYPVKALFPDPRPPVCPFGICLPRPGPFPGEVLFAGAAPQLVNGATVVIVRIPQNAFIGTAMPLDLQIVTGLAPPELTAAAAIVSIR